MQRNWQIWIVEYMLGMVWSSCYILELIVLYLVSMRIGFWEVHKHTFKFYICFIFKCEGVEFSFRVCFWNLSSASLFFILNFVFFMCVSILVICLVKEMNICFVWLLRKCGEMKRNWQVWILEFMLGMSWSSCCIPELIILCLVSEKEIGKNNILEVFEISYCIFLTDEKLCNLAL